MSERLLSHHDNSLTREPVRRFQSRQPQKHNRVDYHPRCYMNPENSQARTIVACTLRTAYLAGIHQSAVLTGPLQHSQYIRLAPPPEAEDISSTAFTVTRPRLHISGTPHYQKVPSNPGYSCQPDAIAHFGILSRRSPETNQ